MPKKCQVKNGDSVCLSDDIDTFVDTHFDEQVCRACKQLNEDLYQLITRKDAVEKFLVPADAFKMLKFATKLNPINSNWSPMKLYLKKHVLEVAVRRFGSEELLIEEVQKREKRAFAKDSKHVDDALKELTSFNDMENDKSISLSELINNRISNVVSSEANSTSNNKRKHSTSSTSDPLSPPTAQFKKADEVKNKKMNKKLGALVASVRGDK